MGTLLEAFENSGRTTGPRCRVDTLREQLDGDDREQFLTLLADNTVEGSRLARALESIGYEITGATIRRHRNGECRCGW